MLTRVTELTTQEHGRSAEFVLTARAVEPSCSGAIYITAKGAQRIADLCRPVFDAIDAMYASLIRKGWLEAYLLKEPVFYKDQARAASSAQARADGKVSSGTSHRGDTYGSREEAGKRHREQEEAGRAGMGWGSAGGHGGEEEEAYRCHQPLVAKPVCYELEAADATQLRELRDVELRQVWMCLGGVECGVH